MVKAITSGVAALLMMAAVTIGAQTKTITGEMKTVSVTVEAIEQSTRQVTAKKTDGTEVAFYVPKSVKAFDQLKIGDTINAKYYENLVLKLKESGSPDVDKSAGKFVPVEGAPAGTMSYQRTVTATITAIDPTVPSITFTGPNNWKYSSRVEDAKALSKVKVGDKVDITWTYAVLMSIEGK